MLTKHSLIASRDRWIDNMTDGQMSLLTYFGWQKECISPHYAKPGNMAQQTWPLLLIIPRRYFFCGSFVLFMYCAFHALMSVNCCIVVTCWERADKWALVCDVSLCFCHFPTWYPGSGVVLDLSILIFTNFLTLVQIAWMTLHVDVSWCQNFDLICHLLHGLCMRAVRTLSGSLLW